jgi:hypothetical protein
MPSSFFDTSANPIAFMGLGFADRFVPVAFIVVLSAYDIVE